MQENLLQRYQTIAIAFTIAFSPFGLEPSFGQPIPEKTVQYTQLKPILRNGDPHVYRIDVDISVENLTTRQNDSAAYRLDLSCTPESAQSDASTPQRVRYRCERYSILKNGKESATIPKLVGLEYSFSYPSAEIAPEGEAYGIPMARFQGLQNSDGKAIGAQNEFLLYNAFTDYHVLCNVYAQNTVAGKGIQDLNRAGDLVKHVTTGTRAPLGEIPGLSEGSEFIHGTVTLQFEGQKTINRKRCAVFLFSAKDNQFKMVIKPAPNFTVLTEGTTEHSGSFCVDLDSGWVINANMTEKVVTSLTVQGTRTGKTIVNRKLRLTRQQNP